MASWVFHIGAFIVPRQMVELGDPARRSADACESFGAMLKKLIKHATCRRRRTVDASGAKSLTGGEGSQQLWKTAFIVGYIQQAFSRACVRESLQHGPENAPFLQRAQMRAARPLGAPQCLASVFWTRLYRPSHRCMRLPAPSERRGMSTPRPDTHRFSREGW